MSDIIQSVWDVVNQFIVDGKGMHVTLNDEVMQIVSKDIKNKLDDIKDNWWGYPKCLDEKSADIDYEMLVYELIADSINYQYWYGKYDIRPNGACANQMYNMLNQSFETIRNNRFMTVGHMLCLEVIDEFIKRISIARFPNLEKRIKHLNEISNFISDYDIEGLADSISNNKITIDEFLKIIISRLPGYAEDIFLKRAFLVPTMLYRRIQWFKDEIEILPVPADYQLPKVLEGLGCISYDYKLSEKIQNHDLILSGSLEECEIRAATILAGKRLSELTGFSMCDIDTYLWLNRKTIDKPFHLTVTSNY